MIVDNSSPIKEAQGYLALTSGDIYSIKTNRLLKPFTSNSGYLVVSISENGKIKKYSIHRLIANAFLQKTEENCWVNHIDGNKTNNSLSNLEWTSPSKNNQHSYDTGLNISKKGEKHFAAKLSDLQVEEIRAMLADGCFYKKIANKYNVSEALIGLIKRNERRHK